MRRSFAVGTAAVALSVFFTASVLLMAPPVREPPVEQARAGTDLVTFEGSNASFWPFLSPEPRFRAHSPINVVVLGVGVEDVVQLMGEQGWNRTGNETRDAGSDAFSFGGDEPLTTNLTWARAGGAPRYAFLHDGSHGAWVRQDAQLHHGHYFTQRLHMRLYGSPIPGEWVAIQAHTEHFDWFTLRHAVDGAARAQLHIEADLMGKSFVKEIWRKHLGNAGASDADGWASIIELALVPGGAVAGTVSFGAFVRRHVTPEDMARLRALGARASWDHLFLVASIVALVLGVRLGGLVLERTTDLGPYVVGALLFPLLAAGVPVAAYVFGHRMEHRMEAGLLAGGALALSSLLDYGFLGVDVLALPVVTHRAGLILAVSWISAGAARRATRRRHLNGLVTTGALLWLGLVASTLLGWV